MRALWTFLFIKRPSEPPRPISNPLRTSSSSKESLEGQMLSTLIYLLKIERLWALCGPSIEMRWMVEYDLRSRFCLFRSVLLCIKLNQRIHIFMCSFEIRFVSRYIPFTVSCFSNISYFRGNMSHLLSANENEASQRKSDFNYIEGTEVIFSPNPNKTMNQILPNLELSWFKRNTCKHIDSIIV